MTEHHAPFAVTALVGLVALAGLFSLVNPNPTGLQGLDLDLDLDFDLGLDFTDLDGTASTDPPACSLTSTDCPRLCSTCVQGDSCVSGVDAATCSCRQPPACTGCQLTRATCPTVCAACAPGSTGGGCVGGVEDDSCECKQPAPCTLIPASETTDLDLDDDLDLGVNLDLDEDITINEPEVTTSTAPPPDEVCDACSLCGPGMEGGGCSSLDPATGRCRPPPPCVPSRCALTARDCPQFCQDCPPGFMGGGCVRGVDARTCSCKQASPCFDERAPQEKRCRPAGGIWRRFVDDCTDTCDFARGLRIGCAYGITHGCDCGRNKCWSGFKCEPNGNFQDTTTSCNTDRDCPLMTCLTEPCSFNVCRNGFCKVTTTPMVEPKSPCLTQGYKCTSPVRGCGHNQEYSLACEGGALCCGDIPRCGDGVCFRHDIPRYGETHKTCPRDCAEIVRPVLCGNGECDPREERTCPDDCTILIDDPVGTDPEVIVDPVDESIELPVRVSSPINDVLNRILRDKATYKIIIPSGTGLTAVIQAASDLAADIDVVQTALDTDQAPNLENTAIVLSLWNEQTHEASNALATTSLRGARLPEDETNAVVDLLDNGKTVVYGDNHDNLVVIAPTASRLASTLRRVASLINEQSHPGNVLELKGSRFAPVEIIHEVVIDDPGSEPVNGHILEFMAKAQEENYPVVIGSQASSADNIAAIDIRGNLKLPLKTDAAFSTRKPGILLGGPCGNRDTAEVLDVPFRGRTPNADCARDFTEGEGILLLKGDH
ncbi:MAG: hypothetical protein QGG83_00590, partial [Candidatus Woesearchaeota archaeon]|nr:hypothetical protein [Candidatus Woesearchaeota archaeon]